MKTNNKLKAQTEIGGQLDALVSQAPKIRRKVIMEKIINKRELKEILLNFDGIFTNVLAALIMFDRRECANTAFNVSALWDEEQICNEVMQINYPSERDIIHLEDETIIYYKSRSQKDYEFHISDDFYKCRIVYPADSSIDFAILESERQFG